MYLPAAFHGHSTIISTRPRSEFPRLWLFDLNHSLPYVCFHLPRASTSFKPPMNLCNQNNYMYVSFQNCQPARCLTCTVKPSNHIYSTLSIVVTVVWEIVNWNLSGFKYYWYRYISALPHLHEATFKTLINCVCVCACLKVGMLEVALVDNSSVFRTPRLAYLSKLSKEFWARPWIKTGKFSSHFSFLYLAFIKFNYYLKRSKLSFCYHALTS